MSWVGVQVDELRAEMQVVAWFTVEETFYSEREAGLKLTSSMSSFVCPTCVECVLKRLTGV